MPPPVVAYPLRRRDHRQRARAMARNRGEAPGIELPLTAAFLVAGALILALVALL